MLQYSNDDEDDDQSRRRRCRGLSVVCGPVTSAPACNGHVHISRTKSNLTFQATLPGIVQYKRPALEKSGVPVYQPSATAAAAAAYQQAALALQMQQQFVPVSCEYMYERLLSF